MCVLIVSSHDKGCIELEMAILRLIKKTNKQGEKNLMFHRRRTEFEAKFGWKKEYRNRVKEIKKRLEKRDNNKLKQNMHRK